MSAALLSRARLREILSRFPDLKIGLVGDLFLDRYLDLVPGARELSIETGLEAYQVGRVRNSPGALGTVMNNLAALGVGVIRPLTVVGDDGEAYDLLRCLRRLGIVTDDVLQDPGRQTPTYTKPMQQNASGEWRELNRLDLRSRGPLAANTTQAVIQRLDALAAQVDGLVVLDQIAEDDWGVVNGPVREHLAALVRRCPQKLMLIDSRAHIGFFDEGVLKPNRGEACRAAAAAGHAGDAPQAAAWLAEKTRRPVYCTQGEMGILLTMPDGFQETLPAVPVSGPIDTVGAGDSATAALAASLLAGADWREAGQIANLVASLTIQQLGTTGTATPAQVLARRDEAFA